MSDIDEELPELFRVNYKDFFMIGEIIRNYNDLTPTFTGILQVLEYQTIFHAQTKQKIIDAAEELCIMLLECRIHYKEFKKIEILKTPYYLN